MLTADHKVTSDVEQVFIHLAGQSPLPKLHHLLVAPFHLHDQLIGFVNAVAASALHGQRGRIVLKMNSLTDERLTKSLMDASQAGVLIDVIVRGACILSAQVPDQTDNIKVRSIVGRFLEHSRVFYFSSGESEHLYLSSADWMNRNMLRRVEIAWPVLDPHLRQRLIDECLLAYLGDTEDAWSLKANGKYEKTSLGQEKITHSAQQALMSRYEAKK